MASAILPVTAEPLTGPSDRKIRFEYAVGTALLIEIGLVVALAYWSSRPAPPTVPPKVIAVHMVAPPPKPKPPTPKPVVVPKPTPKPPPPIHHAVVHHHVPTPKPVAPPPPAPAPIATPVPPPVPTPVVPAPPPPPPPAPAPVKPPEVDTGIGPYGSGARSLIHNQIHISALIKRLGLQGTVTVSFKVPPGGGAAYDISIVDGSQNPLIRKAALNAITSTNFPPYTHDMPQRPLKFKVPIEITAE